MHLRALDPAAERTRGVRVTDVVEPADGARQALRDSGYRVHGTLADLLGTRRPDGVLVAAPTDRHTEVARAALAAGVPVLCEKPAGLDWREIEETGRIAAERGVALQVAYWRRFVPAMVALRERVLAGELGQVLHVVCAQWDGAPPRPQFRRSSGGAFVDMGVHEFDVIRWLTDQSVTSVVAVQTPAPRSVGPTGRRQRTGPARPLRRSHGRGVARQVLPGWRSRHDRGVRLRRPRTSDGARPRRRRRAHARRARPASGVVRRARPGRTSSRCGDGGCRCRAAGCRSRRRSRDRDVTELDDSVRPIR